MELSFAPMEGVTYPEYRRVHARMFAGADRYYTPFIAPDPAGRFKGAPLRGVLPENNEGLPLVPQLLVNAAGPFLTAARVLADLGYSEVNLNVGCPSGTVTAKHKGAGMLLDPGALDRCLEEIFTRCPISVSVKTRLGYASAAEFPVLLKMLGRGAVCDPALFRRVRGGPALRLDELRGFLDALAEEYLASGLAPAFTAARMKELWYYMGSLFPGEARAAKAIFKARSLPDYRAAVDALLSSGTFDPEAGYHP